MNDVIKYTATTASDNVTDMYDADNFYPMDGIEDDYYEDMSGFSSYTGLDADGEGLDIEYSEAFGDFVKKIGKGLKGGLQKFKSRGGGRDARRSRRRSKRDVRRARRQERRNRRQMELVKSQDPQTQMNVAKIVSANATESPTLKPSVDNTARGTATPIEEQAATTVITEAKKMTVTGATEPPVVKTTTTGQVTEVDDSWWAKQNTGSKVAIIGGGVVVLALSVWGITKIAK
jgi:hypothetical protein